MTEHHHDHEALVAVDPATGQGVGVARYVATAPGVAEPAIVVADDWQGTLVISLGRLARPGEVYVVSSDAFADGEPLDCSGVLGRSLADSLDELAGLDLRISPSADGHPVPPEAFDAAAADRYGSWIVTRGSALSPTDVILTLQPTAPVPPPAEDDC